MKSRRRIVAIFSMWAVAGLGVWFCGRPYWPLLGNWWRNTTVSRKLAGDHLTRPPGMAPAAFNGFVRACNRAHVNPWRISQTLGNHPRSVGYHLRDGFVSYQGKRLEYSAAVDMATDDLDRQQIDRLVACLGREGFAAFYRSGPKWRDDEHIHAVYAALPMKPQLRRQVRQWVAARKRSGQKSYAWERKFRRYWA